MKRKTWLKTALILTCSVLLTGCGGNKETETKTKTKSDKKNNVLKVMETSEMGTLDTLFTQDEAAIIAQTNVFEGLYQLDKDDKIIPGVAEDEPEISEDGKTYTIKLRKDSKWTNGDPVTAHDFVFAWRKLCDPAFAANYIFLGDGTFLNGTEVINGEKKPEELGVEALDDYTLEVKLEKPVPYFTSLLTFPAFFPQNEKYVKEQGDKYGTTSDNVLYNGAFLIEDWDQASLTWKLIKNDDYFDADKVKLKQIDFQVVKETGTAFNLYESNELDVAVLAGDYAKQNADNKDYKAIPRSFVNYFKLNQIRNGKPSIFANKNVRKAVSYALDNKTLVENILADGSTDIYGYIPKDFVKNPETGEDFRKESGDLNKTDPKLAKEYWEKAQKEVDGNITIELLTNDTDSDKKVAEFIQGQLEEALPGLKLTIKTVPKNNAIELTRKGDYELCVGSWGPDYQDPMTFFNNLKTGNNSNYTSEKFNQLLDDAENKYGNDPKKRWETLIEAERVLVEEDAGIVPIYQQAQGQLVRPSVKDIQVHSFGAPFTYKTAYKK